MRQKMRAIAWVIAALNSVEPAIFPLLMIDVFNKGEPWTEAARPKFMERLESRLKCMSDALGDKDGSRTASPSRTCCW